MRKQGPAETVDEYVVAIQDLASQIEEKPSDEIIRYAITSGLRPKIAGHVMAFNKINSVDELLEAARAAEMMTSATPDASAVESLTAEVKRLSDQFAAATVRSVRPQSPSVDRRRVAFADRDPTPPPPVRPYNARNNTPVARALQSANYGYNNVTSQPQQQQPPQQQQTGPRGNPSRCPACFGKHGPRPTDCFAYNKICYVCQGFHHFARCHGNKF